MSLKKNNITLDESQQSYLSGIEQVSAVIRKSYGPKGQNVTIEQEFYPFHIIANDAQSIIQSIHIEDPVQRRGLNFIKELSDKASKDSGEGRKTTIIIAEELLKCGKGGMEFKEDLDKLLPIVLEEINKQLKRVEIEDIAMVAETSSRSKEISAKIAEIYQIIGREGIIQVESSGTYDTSYAVTAGIRFPDAGWLSPYMEFAERGKAIYEKPIILVTKKKIEKDKDIEGLVNKCVKEGLPLVIFTDDIDVGVASKLIATHRAEVAKILIIKAPILYKQSVFEDFAKCVGATIVENGIEWAKLPIEFLGTCDRLITDKEDTILIGIKDLTDWKNELRLKADDESIRRVYQLNTKTAILKIGAGSESELSYKRLKAMDACNACRLALSDGIVEGGAMSLVKASDVLTETASADVFRKAMLAPNEQLVINNSGKLDTQGIYDSALVIKNAIRNAVSLAGIVLSTGADIRLKEESQEDKQIKILSMQANRPRM